MKKIFSLLLLLLVIFSPVSVFAASSYYTNVSGSKIHVPVYKKVAPIGASAQCRDLSYSFSTHKRGTCSHHGGVYKWIN